jgi:ABC-2 type transport system permease protein
MVALLVGLRWRQLGHQLTRNPWMIVTLVVTGLMALGFLALLAVGLVAMRVAAPDTAVTVLVLTGAVIVAGWWIGSLLVSGDDSLAPERFALLPVTARRLLPGLVVAGATTIGGIGTTLALLLMLLGWSVNLLALAVGLLIVPLALATCVLGARVISGLLAGWLARRRSRDLVMTIGVLLAACSGLLINLGLAAVREMGDIGSAFTGAAEVVAWTPLGAVFGAPASIIAGDIGAAGLRLLIALATIVALWFAARALLAARLVAPIQSSGGGRVRSGGIVDRMLPATPVGAIAARTLRYFRRDPRQVINVVMMLLLPAILIGVVFMNGLQDESIGFGPVITLVPAIDALLAGTIIQMAIAYDNDAVALHVLTGVRGSADRYGRLLGFAIIAVPLVIVLSVASCVLAGRLDLLPGSLGAALGLGAISAGAGAWTGSFLPGRAPAPEANPFGRGSSGGVQSLAAMAIMSPITLILGAPALGFAIAAFWVPALGWVSLACGLVIGAAAIWAGAELGGRILDRRWPQVLAEVSSEA